MKQLKKVYNRFIPFKGFNAITILKWMFIREEYFGILPWYTENHENIHYAQERELAFIFIIWNRIFNQITIYVEFYESICKCFF